MGCGLADMCAGEHRKPGRHSSCCWSWWHRYSVVKKIKCTCQNNAMSIPQNDNELKVPIKRVGEWASWQHDHAMIKAIKSQNHRKQHKTLNVMLLWAVLGLSASIKARSCFLWRIFFKDPIQASEALSDLSSGWRTCIAARPACCVFVCVCTTHRTLSPLAPYTAYSVSDKSREFGGKTSSRLLFGIFGSLLDR